MRHLRICRYTTSKHVLISLFRNQPPTRCKLKLLRAEARIAQYAPTHSTLTLRSTLAETFYMLLRQIAERFEVVEADSGSISAKQYNGAPPPARPPPAAAPLPRDPIRDEHNHHKCQLHPCRGSRLRAIETQSR